MKQATSAKTLFRILVVDDEPINIRVIARIFDDDYKILVATDGIKALEIAAVQHPDLILLDVTMPGVDGYEVCRRLKSNTQTDDIPVIFVTANTDPFKEVEGFELGAVDYIAKPINPAVVRARVNTHLHLVQAKRENQEIIETLDYKVKERTAELKSAMESLNRLRDELTRSEAKATLSTLIASISHELGTPIGNSALISDMLGERAGQLLDNVEAGQLKRSDLGLFLDELRESTDVLQRNLHRAKDLLLNFSQVAADQASERRRAFDLSRVIHEVVATLAPKYKKNPCHVVIDIADGIAMDSLPGPLGQVVINIVNNAYLHAFEDRTTGTLTIRAEQNGDEVHLSFADDGIGIPAENLSRLFEPFFSTKIGRSGTGLGMAIVEDLVCKSLAGSITVKSTVGVGTTFDIKIPQVKPAAQT